MLKFYSDPKGTETQRKFNIFYYFFLQFEFTVGYVIGRIT